MRGGLSKMSEAGCVVGGHSFRDGEIKFGYAITGLEPNHGLAELGGGAIAGPSVGLAA